MDGLALLCNLHADGPLTMRRLHEAGVNSLGDLEVVTASTLAVWLGLSSAQTRRFVEEARHLALRLAESPLEPENSPGALDPAVREELDPAAREEEPTGWFGFQRPAPRAGDARERPFALDPSEDPLQPDLLEGLDAETCARLAGEGVLSAQSLTREASLALARRAGISYTKLLELARQGRLHCAGSLAEIRRGAPSKAHSVELVPEPPRRSPSLKGFSSRSSPALQPEPGAAGPFG